MRPVLLRFGSEAQKQDFSPGSRRRLFFCIGMSEPDSGSDLASSARARTPWTAAGASTAGNLDHQAHRVPLHHPLLRTSAAEGSRHAGFSQFLVDLKAPG